MRRLLAAVILLPLAAAGCVQMTWDAVIDRNGGGSCEVVYALSPLAEEAIAELRADPEFGAQLKMPYLAWLDRGALEKACAEGGLTLRDYEPNKVADRREVRLVLGFRKLHDLARAVGARGGESSGLGIFGTRDGNYWLRTASARKSASQAPLELGEEAGSREGALGPQSDQGPGAAPEAGSPAPTPDLDRPDNQQVMRAAAAIRKLMQTAPDLRVVIRITLPGDVLECNAARVEGRTVIWEITPATARTAPQGPRVLFSGEGLSIDAPLWQDEEPGK